MVVECLLFFHGLFKRRRNLHLDKRTTEKRHRKDRKEGWENKKGKKHADNWAVDSHACPQKEKKVRRGDKEAALRRNAKLNLTLNYPDLKDELERDACAFVRKCITITRLQKLELFCKQKTQQFWAPIKPFLQFVWELLSLFLPPPFAHLFHINSK